MCVPEIPPFAQDLLKVSASPDVRHVTVSDSRLRSLPCHQ